MKLKRKFILTTLTLSVLALFTIKPNSNAQNTEKNIALGKEVTVQPKPQYHSMKDDNPAQLTDGKFGEAGKMLWIQRGTLTWSHVHPVEIVVDLGSVRPVSGVMFSTASNSPSGISWPEKILVSVSEDKQNWYYQGDLVLNSAAPNLKNKGYASFRYKTTNWQTKGRYVAFGINQKQYTVVDEIEVYEGNSAWLDKDIQGTPVASMAELARQETYTDFAKKRIDADIESVRGYIAQSRLAQSRKNELAGRLNQYKTAVQKMPLVPVDFKAVFPFNEIHQDIFRIYAQCLASEGVAPLTVWKQHRYSFLPVFSQPEKQNAPSLNFSMLGNQQRSDAILLTNASDEVQKILLDLQEIPQGATKGWLQISQVELTDNITDIPVADVLVPVEAGSDGKYQITVPAGMTRKIWFTVDSTYLPPISYQGSLIVKTSLDETRVPLNIGIADIKMQKPRLSLTTWDYSATSGGRPGEVTAANQEALISLMRSHYVDTAWASEWGVAFKRYAASDFDAQGRFITKPDFSRIKAWRDKWPDARRYFVFWGSLERDPSFGGAKMGTPEFNARLGSWAKALMEYLPEVGLTPQQFALCIVDEPNDDRADEIIEAWTRAIKAATPEFQIFTDPMWPSPETNKNQAAITLANLICVKPPLYFKGSQERQEYFDNLKQQEKELWFYQCSGPVRLFDPQHYFRQQAWLAFAAGASGHGFWSFTDNGRAASSWNEYGVSRQVYTPVFIDKTGVHSSLHWEAVREGMQDNEELSMLRDVIERSDNAELKQQAQKVLDEAVKAVVAEWRTPKNISRDDIKNLKQYRAEIVKYRQTSLNDWRLNHDVNIADQQLEKVRAMLIALSDSTSSKHGR